MFQFKYLNLVTPVDCQWNDWQIGKCSKSCGGGTRTKTRTKKTESSDGGICEGEATMQEACNTQQCPIGKILLNWLILET